VISYYVTSQPERTEVTYDNWILGGRGISHIITVSLKVADTYMSL
jgi:Na+/proline symporter